VKEYFRPQEFGTHQSYTFRDICRKHNICEQTFFRWRARFGGMTVSDAHKLKELEAENLRLKKIVAEQMLAIEGLKEIATKKWRPRQADARRLRF
jgi:putative transposase